MGRHEHYQSSLSLLNPHPMRYSTFLYGLVILAIIKGLFTITCHMHGNIKFSHLH